MGALPKKKGPVKGGKGGRKTNTQSNESAPSWALEQLALEQDTADSEVESEEEEEEGEQGSFPRLEHACSLCGAEPAEGSGKRWKACGACGITQYCSADCQREAWKRPVGHKSSCGAPLPTPGAVAAASPDALAALLAQWCRADVELAGLVLARAARLTKQSSKRPALVRCGLAGACVTAMGVHLHTRALQQDGCAALGGAALGAKEGRAAVCVAGGATCVVAAMRAHEQAASVQQSGCWALRQIAVGGAEPQAAVLEAGGAAAVIVAMALHADTAAVVQEGCSALGNMAGADLPSQRAVLAAGGAAAAVAALGGPHGGSAAVAAQAIGALGNIAGGDDGCQRGALDAGAAAAVVAALATHAASPSVQQGGRAALANMAWGGGEPRDLVLAAGAEAEWLT